MQAGTLALQSDKHNDMLGEAGQTACRQDPELQRFYQRLLKRRNRPKAKMAVARKLLVRSFIKHFKSEFEYHIENKKCLVDPAVQRQGSGFFRMETA